MKKYYINGWRAYDYKGHTIAENQERKGEKKYCYYKKGTIEILGYARTLELAKLWIELLGE